MKLSMSREGYREPIGNVDLTEADFDVARRYLLGQNEDWWDPQTPGSLTTAQTMTAPGRARIVIVYIEVSPETLFSQNAARDAAVPMSAMQNLAGKLEPPGDWEAHQVIREIDAGKSSKPRR